MDRPVAATGGTEAGSRIGAWVAAGLYDPEAEGARDRLALLRWLEEQDVTLQEMVRADAEGRLFAVVGDRFLRGGDDGSRAVVAQADLWLVETPNRKRRPVLVVSRDEVIPVLDNVVVAPLTSTIRQIPTCIPVGPEHEIDHDSVAAFDNLAAVPKSVLTRRLGSLGLDGRRRICEALAAMANC